MQDTEIIKIFNLKYPQLKYPLDTSVMYFIFKKIMVGYIDEKLIKEIQKLELSQKHILTNLLCMYDKFDAIKKINLYYVSNNIDSDDFEENMTSSTINNNLLILNSTDADSACYGMNHKLVKQLYYENIKPTQDGANYASDNNDIELLKLLITWNIKPIYTAVNTAIWRNSRGEKNTLEILQKNEIMNNCK